MKFSKHIWGVLLLSAVGSSVVKAEPVLWERGCGVRDIPRVRYEDLRYATPPEYYPVQRSISWQANSWNEPQQNYQASGPDAGRRYQRLYRNNPRVYGQQNYYDPYADFEYVDPDYTGYPPRNAADRRDYYAGGQYVPQYYDSYPTLSRRSSRHAMVDDSYRNQRAAYFAPEFDDGMQNPSRLYRDNEVLIKKQAIYPSQRVYTSAQSTIVGESSSVPYGNKVSRMVQEGAKPKRGIVLPGPESIYPRQGINRPAVDYVTSAGKTSSIGETESRASVSNAYFPRQGMFVVDTQKKSALPTQGQK